VNKRWISNIGRALALISAKIVRHKKAFVLGFVFTFMFFPPITHAVVAPNSDTKSKPEAVIVRNEGENYYLRAVNDLRYKNNLAPLTLDIRLNESASAKAIDMINNQYFSHWAPNGKSFSDFIWHDSPRAITVGENLAKCFKSREDAFAALVNSPTHYAIMVGNFTNFGVAEKYDSHTNCTQTVMHFSYYVR